MQSSGFQIPPAPPRPDFDASREKLQKLGEGESTMTKDEFQKMKQELEQYVFISEVCFIGVFLGSIWELAAFSITARG